MCRNGDISLEAQRARRAPPDRLATASRRAPFCASSSKAEAKGQLHRARAANLEEGTQLTQDAARAESVSKRLGGGAKARTGRVESQLPGIPRIAGISEVGMIEDVERFRAKLEAQTLRHPELTMKREVDLPRAKTT